MDQSIMLIMLNYNNGFIIISVLIAINTKKKLTLETKILGKVKK
jgi:hypothetical protein